MKFYFPLVQNFTTTLCKHRYLKLLAIQESIFALKFFSLKKNIKPKNNKATANHPLFEPTYSANTGMPGMPSANVWVEGSYSVSKHH